MADSLNTFPFAILKWKI